MTLTELHETVNLLQSELTLHLDPEQRYNKARSKRIRDLLNTIRKEAPSIRTSLVAADKEQ